MSNLFDDVKAMAKHSTALAPLEVSEPVVSALEKGERTHPDGTYERYERVEFHQ